MQFRIDHDYHLHTFLSVCANDEQQLAPNMILDAKRKGLRSICITDHYWDERVSCNTAVDWWYEKQNHAHICQSLPLPVDDCVEVLFGCEADMDSDNVIGLSPSRYDEFDFIVVATTHFHHMTLAAKGYSNEEAAVQWVKRLEAVLTSNLPMHKVGVAHLACDLINRESREDYLDTLQRIPLYEMERLFALAAQRGVGIELNYGDVSCKETERDVVFRMFQVAKKMGCKFYLGTDAHTRKDAPDSVEVFQRAIEILGLKEEDKFVIRRR